MKLQFTWIIALLFASLFIIGASGCYSTAPATIGSGNSVSIDNFAFNPSELTVSAGTTVTWTNNQQVTHTITFDDGSLNQQIASGATVQKTFSTAGTYTYHCSIHPSMKGTIIVQ